MRIRSALTLLFALALSVACDDANVVVEDPNAEPESVSSQTTGVADDGTTIVFADAQRAAQPTRRSAPAPDEEHLIREPNTPDPEEGEFTLEEAVVGMPIDGTLVLELGTTFGTVLCELYADRAPNTVANFVSLAENKKYDGLKFHRVEPNFVVQGGDPKSADDDPTNDGQGGPGYQIPCECFADNARLHFRGSLSMAHSGKDTGGSQFFITHRPTAHLNPDAESQRGHTVFGYVTKGMDVVDKIRAGDSITSIQVLSKRDHKYMPRKVGDPEELTLDKPDDNTPPDADKPEQPKSESKP